MLGVSNGHNSVPEQTEGEDRKSTRLNSSHSQISYAVFCLKKKNNICPAENLSVDRISASDRVSPLSLPSDAEMYQLSVVASVDSPASSLGRAGWSCLTPY